MTATQRTHALDCDMDEDCACGAGCDEGDEPGEVDRPSDRE